MESEYPLEETIHEHLENHSKMFLNGETYYVIKASEKKDEYVSHIDVKVYSKYYAFMGELASYVMNENIEVKGYKVQKTFYKIIYYKNYGEVAYDKGPFSVMEYGCDLKTERSVILFAKELFDIDSTIEFYTK